MRYSGNITGDGLLNTLLGKDFINVVNEVVKRIHGDKFGPDMNWFFDQTLYGTGSVIIRYPLFNSFNSKYQL